MSFKDAVIADCKNVFLNVEEFAALHTVKYDGNVFPDIPVLLTKVKETERTVSPDMQGVHRVSAVAHIAQADLGGAIPEQKRQIQINDGYALGEPFFVKYRILTSDCEAGMVYLELEAYDE